MATGGLLVANLAAFADPIHEGDSAYRAGYLVGAYAVPLIIAGVLLWAAFLGVRAVARRVMKGRQAPE